MTKSQLAIRDKTEAQHRFQQALRQATETFRGLLQQLRPFFQQLADAITEWWKQAKRAVAGLNEYRLERQQYRRRMHHDYRRRMLARRGRR